MPRAGLTTAAVVAAGAALADECGFHNVTMGLLAERLGVRTPSLYKHVESLADLQHRIAGLAAIEISEAVGRSVQGLAGRDALAALAKAMREYVMAHPGAYTATVGAEIIGQDDPLDIAGRRLIGSMSAVLRGYGIADVEMDHALRAVRSILHGFAVLQASNGFQWAADPDVSFAWMVDFVDRGLRVRSEPAG
ncbi:TetR/AcrR family transcriptional regulator [Acidothermaceae bacterium B102]|nr:TetR/AcrR family transcriptional regulator [Acidothermaceae bacterium B102]